MKAPAPVKTPAPSVGVVRGATLQRKCACGQHTIAGGQCDSCREEELEKLQRSPTSASAPTFASPIVHEVLNSPGQPLDRATRDLMEPRFGHDFSRVRLHTGSKAAESARALNALAYTIGGNIVLGGGGYDLRTSQGKQLIAHELTHVVQQSGTTATPGGPVQVGEPTSRQEREADGAARSVLQGETAPRGTSEEPMVRRQASDEAISVELVPTSPEEVERLKKLGIDLPKVSEETWRAIGGVSHNSGKPLSAPEKTKIEGILKGGGIPIGTPLATVTGPKFLLHDTSALISSAAIKSHREEGKGPVGKGVSAWVPKTGPATIARPEFFETKRPSTTSFEKGLDIISKADREKSAKVIWSLTNPAEKGPALDATLAGTGLDADKSKAIKEGAKKFLEGASEKGLPDGSLTTAAWAIGEICAKAGQSGVAIASKQKEFDEECKKLTKYYHERPARVGSLVTVEIVQVGLKAKKKGQPQNENTCDPNNPDLAPIPSPAYTNDQYSSLVLLYLRAAYIAGRFPEITTHFVVDAFERGHCDPRCFDLQKLYDLIAATLGHGKGSTYGVAPNYGTKWGANTVWWHDTVCGGPHP